MWCDGPNASACGEANKLLAMVCQPAEVLGLVDIPSHIWFWGIDSGIRHSIGGADYGSVRVGSFMGRKVIKSIASSMVSQTSNGANTEECGQYDIGLLKSEASLDYLCNLTPHRFEHIYAKNLPGSLSGEEFLKKYNDHNDTATVIDGKRTYAVTAATTHPIYENFLVTAFKALLTSTSSEEQLNSLGELLYQCHYSYSACGLGSDGTDRLIQLVQEMQHSKLTATDGTLYGAKITGGGSGGTICVLSKNSAQSTEQIHQIQKRYQNATGYKPFLFEGSSPGAGKFGYLKIRSRVVPQKNH